jgi:hypothetical protein
MYDRTRTIEQILTMLAATPLRLAELIEGLQPVQLLASPAPGDWSARDVLAHLRSCDDGVGGVITRRLVTISNSDGFGKATRTNRVYVCPVADKS